jgi:hypothetical protein
MPALPTAAAPTSPRARARTSWSEQNPVRLALRHSRPSSRPSALVTAARRRPVVVIARRTSARLAPAGTVRPVRRPSGAAAASRSLAPGDVVTLHDSLQVPGRADDQCGVDVIVVEEIPYYADGGGQRSCWSREHRLGSGAQDLIHRSRIRTIVRTCSPLSPSSCQRGALHLLQAPASAMTACPTPGSRGAGGIPGSMCWSGTRARTSSRWHGHVPSAGSGRARNWSVCVKSDP